MTHFMGLLGKSNEIVYDCAYTQQTRDYSYMKGWLNVPTLEPPASEVQTQAPPPTGSVTSGKSLNLPGPWLFSPVNGYSHSTHFIESLMTHKLVFAKHVEKNLAMSKCCIDICWKNILIRSRKSKPCGALTLGAALRLGFEGCPFSCDCQLPGHRLCLCRRRSNS